MTSIGGPGSGDTVDTRANFNKCANVIEPSLYHNAQPHVHALQRARET